MLSDLRYPALHFPVTQTASVKGWLPTWNTSIRQWTSYWKEVGHWGVPLKEILEAARPLLLACPEVIKSPIYHMLLPQCALPQAQDMRQGNLGLKSLKSWVQIISPPSWHIWGILSQWLQMITAQHPGSFLQILLTPWASLLCQFEVSYSPFTDTFPPAPSTNTNGP